ncbi:TetR/AcrR family transcriptional regulator [Limosilactobacillus sp.]|uniref:TetR/AcrR family transcriptional regulator n=1 Tax=Limosilactobacillus sp. TaxID=2773925 RepID=UPI0025BE0F0B|nr:TetR/AcrR family transcriptional regulator [Limosilactobacillus sp.]MCH3921890.1 TetR/AcrR family transcriptional regulator [Limosilactobacillus sp.]MCH3928661.1 TetR/AcrR family transcriptional regulator [Limosilactobacillus sp.]
MGIYTNARKETDSKILSSFWELYQEKPINRITVKELADLCGIGRGTFYNHFHDVYAVLEKIEAELNLALEHKCHQISEKEPELADFNRILYECYSEEITKDYIRLLVLERRDPFFAENYLKSLRDFLLRVCIDKNAVSQSEDEKQLLNCAFNSIIEILLSSICNTSLQLNEINELIVGLLQNGYYITLTNRFGIDGLKNPFSLYQS